MTPSRSNFSRRGFLGLTAAAVPLFAACGGGSASKGRSGGDIKFWNAPAYNDAAKKATESCAPSGSNLEAS